ncbi:MAG TPA: hypothetical protein VMN99_12135 [Anaerolineales bacterium]|nr:hypothetical protein [Anaerolineales bacterium]
MKKKVVFPALCFFLILGSVYNYSTAKSANAATTKTLILYDAASGAIPSPPLMSFTDFPPGAALPAYSSGSTTMDTTVSGQDTYAGWVASGATTPGFPSLNRTAGFQVNFTVQVESESHANNHRAGFSVIILSEDNTGIELAFWQNEVWVQSDDNTGGLFRHGEGIAFATTNGLIDYRVTIIGDSYTLAAKAEPILSGPLRDYSTFDGFPNPYKTPNFLFLGDNTTSAQARVRLYFVSITGTDAEPVTPTGTNTTTSTSTPVPTASPIPLPSVTPVPVTTPAERVFESCPSSGFLAAMITLMMIKKIGRVFDPPETIRQLRH